MKLEFISKSLDYLNNDHYRTKVVHRRDLGTYLKIKIGKQI